MNLAVVSPRARARSLILVALLAVPFAKDALAQWAVDPTEQEKIEAPGELLRAWNDFNAAVDAGDLEKALTFMHPRSQLVAPLRQIGVMQMKKVLANQVDVECKYDFSVFATC